MLNNGDERINELIEITKKGYLHYTDDEILQTYNEICGIVYKKEGNYTEEQRTRLKQRGHLESLAIVQDSIMFNRKDGRYINK